jgi:hypothetical protein
VLALILVAVSVGLSNFAAAIGIGISGTSARSRRGSSSLSWARSVRTCSAVNVVDGLAEVVGERLGRGDGVRAGLDLDGAAAAGGLHELAD